MDNQKLFEYKDRKYNIVFYDTNWQKIFIEKVKMIKSIFGEDTHIEHIGSTSVPGMEGKSCIDILVVLKNLETVKQHILEIENKGYIYRGPVVRQEALLFAKIENNVLKENIHFFPEGHPEISEMIAIRDYLRNHPEEVSVYSKLKRDLHTKYPNDYGEYRKEKDKYMKKLVEKVKSSK